MWYFINYAKKNSVLIHRSMEDGALPSHLRCPLCWIPRTEQQGKHTVGLKLLHSELPWMVGRERSKNRQGMLWTTGRPESSKPHQWILKLGKAFLEASVCMWKMFPHRLIVNPWFSAGVLKNYESFRGWSLTGGGPWGLLAQPHSLSVLSLFWHGKWGVLAICSSRHGCHNLPSVTGCVPSAHEPK